jgi:nucleoside-diphosphate-sugar epimerase
MERIKVIDAAQEVCRYMGYKPKFEFLPEMPTGPYNRVADNALAKKLLGWEPEVMFVDGLHRTIEWYISTKKQEEVAGYLEALLTER